jgi:hypothetical protein
VKSSPTRAEGPCRVLIVAVHPDGKATPLTDITDRVTTAAASLTAGTCYARNRREGRAAIHLAMPGAARALCGVLQGEPAGDPQPSCTECQGRSWGRSDAHRSGRPLRAGGIRCAGRNLPRQITPAGWPRRRSRVVARLAAEMGSQPAIGNPGHASSLGVSKTTPLSSYAHGQAGMPRLTSHFCVGRCTPRLIQLTPVHIDCCRDSP